MAKAGHVLSAMDRHPGKVIIFVDVDCEVRDSLAPLAAATRGDMALPIALKHRRRGVRVKVLSGTLVVRPTPGARRLVEAWAAVSASSGWGEIDQTTLAIAIATTPGVTVEPLETRWCALPGRHQTDSVIVHDHASLDVHKVSNLRHRFWWLWRALARHCD